jgi:predicted dehydrogenase
MAAKLRLGVIGCGFYAQNHLSAWRDLGAEVAVAAVCDVDAAKTTAAAATFAMPKTYSDARQML